MAGRGKKRTQIAGQFNWRLIEMQESPAYRILSLSERRCLDRLEIELGHHAGNDNGKLPVTFDDFESYGVHRHAITKSLRALQALGFVEVTDPGRAGNAEWRRPKLFRLTYRHAAKANPTDEWRRIPTVDQAEAIARAARIGPPEKQKPSGGFRTMGQCGKRTTSGQLHSAETATTWVSAETATTSISRGGRPKRDGAEGTAPAAVVTGKLGSGGFLAEPRTFAVVIGGIVARVGARSLHRGSLHVRRGMSDPGLPAVERSRGSPTGHCVTGHERG